LGRLKPSRATGRRSSPQKKWIDDFERQSTAKGFETKIKRFARMRANMVALAGRRIDEFYVEELVSDAIADTLAGVLAWHPERVWLEKHLLDAIGSRGASDSIRGPAGQTALPNTTKAMDYLRSH
jgi:hypothetical protein